MDKFVTVAGAEILYRSSRDELKAVQEDLTSKIDLKVDGARVSEDGKYLYLTSNDEDVAGPYGPFSGGGGGGGGGSGNNAVLTVKNMTGWVSTSISESSDCSLLIDWSSYEEGDETLPTGNGTLTIKVNGSLKKTADVKQGLITEDIKSYLIKGSNSIKVSVSDVYNNTKTLSFNVTVISLSLTSTFNGASAYTGPISYNYIASGLGDKVIYFILDGEILGTQTISTSGRQSTYIIPSQSHGSHRFEVYFTADIDGVFVESAHLNYDLICYEAGNNAPIISVPLDSFETDQYTTENFEYTVYTPNSLVSPIQIYVDNVLQSDLTVGQLPQTFSYRFNKSGNAALKFVSGSTTKIIDYYVNASDVDIKPVEEDLVLYLTSTGRSNTETIGRDIWEYKDIRAEMTGFDWTSNGWVTGNDGFPVLRLQGNAKVRIPYRPFEVPSDPNKAITITGKTIEIEFATSSVSNYDVPIITCFDNNRGFQITAQEALLKSNQSEISTQYKENEHLRLTFVINKLADDRIIYCFTNGVISGAIQYPTNDSFEQYSEILIGSNEVTTDIYNIRIYDNNLTHYQVVDNWIADMQDSSKMLSEFNRNNVFNENNVITIDKLPMDLPYFVFLGKSLPTSKDSILLDGYFVDRIHPEKSFTFTQAEVGCQGTSSMAYPIKNFKLKFKKAKSWLDPQGNTIKKYAINDEAIATNKFVFKADYASSEGANNVELVRFYNDLCKRVYLTPKQDPKQGGSLKVRQGIDGFPMVVFQDRGDEGIRFIGKYNFNNDKGTPEVYGLSQNGDGTDFSNTDQSWEMKDNNNRYCRWKEAANSAEELLVDEGGFEVRYPDAWQDYWDADDQKPEELALIDATHLCNLQKWVVSTDPDQATNLPLSEVIGEESVTYSGIEYTTDSADYRLAKFKNEVEDHFVLDDAIFYYIYTEFFLMIDSRVKNSFPTRFNSEGKWIWFPYDMDTAIGINNEGKLVYSYNLEDTDYEPGSTTVGVFNGHDAVFWNNLRKCFPNQIATMYKTLRTKSPTDNVSLSYEDIEERYEKHQETWPAAVFNEDAYFKYVIPALGGDSSMGIDSYGPALTMCLGSKSEQRKWWLYNRFRYLDSKYEAGLAKTEQITFRAYEVGDISITPYYDIYIKVQMGESFNFFERGQRNVEKVVPVQLEQMHDTECWINSADQIKAIKGLPNLKPDTVDISKAINLQELDLAATEIDPNPNLKELSVGRNTLLRKLDVRYCPSLTGTIDIVNCSNIKEVYFDGTSITGINLPEGGLIETLCLPNTIKNLDIRGQKEIENLLIEGEFSGLQITSLRIENVNNYTWGRITQIMDKMPPAVGENKNAVRLVGFNYDFATVEEFKRFVADLDTFNGINEAGQTVLGAQVIGTAKIGTDENPGVLDYEYIKAVRERYTNLEILCNIKKTVTFYNYDGSEVLDTQIFTTYTGVPVEEVEYHGEAPTKQDTADIHYTFDGWSTSIGGDLDTEVLYNVTTSLDLYSHFYTTPIYTINFYNYNGIDYSGHTDTPIATVSRIGAGDIEFPSNVNLPSWNNIGMVGWGTVKYGTEDIDCSSDYKTILDVDHNMNIYGILGWPLQSIRVTHNPDKMNYCVNQYFDPTGLIITGTQIVEGDTSHPMDAIFTNYTYKTSRLEASDTILTFSVERGGETVYTQLEIGIGQSIEIITEPSIKFYFVGDTFDSTGLSLRVTYSNGVTEIIYGDTEGFDCTSLYMDPDGKFTDAGNLDVYFNYYTLSTPYKIFVVENIDDDVLNNNSWQTISAVCEMGMAQAHWHIGQEKIIDIPAVEYPTKDSTNRTKAFKPSFRIVAFDHNKEVESPDQYTITFGLAGYSIAPENGDVCIGETSIATSYTMDHTQGFGRGDNLILRSLDIIYNACPEDFKPYVKEVTKNQSDYSWDISPREIYTSAIVSADIISSRRVKFFIPSEYELTGSNSSRNAMDEGALDSNGHPYCKQFEYYKTDLENPDRSSRELRMRNHWNGEIKKFRYWTRTFERWWLINNIDYYFYSSIGGDDSGVQPGEVDHSTYSNGSNGIAIFFNI